MPFRVHPNVDSFDCAKLDGIVRIMIGWFWWHLKSSARSWNDNACHQGKNQPEMATDFVSIRTRNRNPILDNGTVQGEWSWSPTTFWPNISQREDAMIHSPSIQASSMTDRLQNRQDQ
jgi:hypothetical protein